MEMMRIAALIALMASPLGAQEKCGPTKDIYELLYSKYGEQRITAGVAENGAVFEMWGGVDGDTWTILVTKPDGQSCALAAGVGWHTEYPKDGDPA